MADESNTTAVRSKPGIMTLVKALGAISVLVLIQVLAVSFLMPSRAETAQIAQKLAAADSELDSEHSTAVSGEQDLRNINARDMLEVSLGSYHVVTYNADTGSSLNIDFDLYGTVLADEEGEFNQLFAITENRLHEQINITVRGSELTDLSDPDLDLLKRKILEKTNRTLGKPLIHEAVFSKFSFIER